MRWSAAWLFAAGAGDLFLDAGEFESAVGDALKYAVEVGLVSEVAGQGGDPVAGFDGESVEPGREALAQATPDGDAKSARFHGSCSSRSVPPPG
jgi:hypothetical protein